MGFAFDKTGYPIYTTDKPIIRYPKEEKVIDPTSKKVLGKRVVIAEFKEDPQVSKPSEMGWFQKIEFEQLVLVRIADPSDNYRIKPKIFLRKAVFDAEKYFTFNKCNHCEAYGLSHKFHYARSMTDSIVVLCWQCAVRYGKTSMLAQTLADREGKACKWIKIVKETPMSAKDAEAWCQRNNKVVPVFVQMMLNGAEVI
jgi:hypothetical protein